MPSVGKMLAPVMHELVARSNSSLPQGKTQAEYDSQGRYNYTPSKAAAIAFCILYIIIVAYNLFQYFYHRSWFWWSMVLAVIMELIGYIARIVSIHKITDKGPFIIQTIFLLVAPAVMAAACYQGFGRLVLWVLPPHLQTAKTLWLPARRITPLFVSFDVVSFFVQCIGGAMVASADTASKENRGRDVVLVGLALQLCTFGFFVISSLRFSMVLVRIKSQSQIDNNNNSSVRKETSNTASNILVNLPTDTRWRLFLTTINIASILILVRSVYRFVEFAISTHNYLSDNEWVFYVLDAMLILFVVVGFMCFHPGNYLPYLKMRRREQVFSKNVGKGLFGGFARWQGDRAVGSRESEYPMSATA